jgi:hypothetical protein
MRSLSSAWPARTLPPLFATVLLSLCAAGSAHARDPSPANSKELAQQRFQEATQAYQEGRYAAAASLFEAADRLMPHAIVRYNAATAWEQAGEDARAATGYEAALALDSLDAARRETARERLTGLEVKLGRIHIQEPLGAVVTVDHVQRTPVPLTFYLRPGSYDINAEYRGEQRVTHAQVGAGESRELELDLPVPESAAPPPESVPPSTPTPPIDDGESQTTWGWVGVGASVALSGAAIVFGARALSTRNRFVSSGKTDADLRQSATDLRLTSNLLWGDATLTDATGLVLLLTAPTVKF